MKTTVSIILLCLFTINIIMGQGSMSLKMLESTADSLYNTGKYPESATCYIKAAELADFNTKKSGLLYNAACCFALNNNTDDAFGALTKAIALGYANKKNMANDPDLKSLHSSKKWKLLLEGLKDADPPNTDPLKAKFVTEDIHRFWKAYDLAQKDTANFKEIFKTYYFDKATKGMNDYAGMKISSIDYFIKHIRSAPNYYASIKSATLSIDEKKAEFSKSFQKLKELYPSANFPDVYFIIGAFTSGGTVSNAGLLLGINQNAGSDNTPIDELGFVNQTRMGKIKDVPFIIAHELIHFQQGGLKNDTTTLSYAIREGMADFIGELISGIPPNEKLYNWAAGKEKSIWNNFLKDMYFNRYSNWIANGITSSPDNLPDQGYWIGYQICKSYYDHATDKKKAIADMLTIRDYKKFLEDSRWEETLSKM